LCAPSNSGRELAQHTLSDESTERTFEVGAVTVPAVQTMIAFEVSDMTTALCAGAVTKALKAADHNALVRVDLATFTVEIEPSSATARQLSDAIKRAGYSPVAA
jgi:copper chaperone